MNEKTFATLEFNKIKKILEGHAISEMGKQKCQELVPSLLLEEINNWQSETSEAQSMIYKKGSLPLGGIKNIESAVKHAQMGGVLNLEEFVNITDFFYVCRKVKNYSINESNTNKEQENLMDSFPILSPMFSGVELMASLEKEISRCVISSTEVSDDASPALAEIRRSVKVSNSRIKEHLNSVIHSASYKTMLQDFVITMRNDRYCVSVKSEYRNSFPGMVHDQSQTGATLFIEPMSVVTLNNKIKELMAQEKVEINKILQKLSGLVSENGEQLLINSEILTYLDFVFAKGELSISINATKPIFNVKGEINIKKGRHPLLDPKKVVPTDIYIGKDYTTLLITGPNTGGKTVALKTLGLFQLMGQSGLHIPAFDNSSLSIFNDIFADIGDEQSIEQSLSTFSAHMTNIVSILEKATEKSLVLLDELGAGTDPTEGAALAIAILQHLHKKGIITAVTTHYSELKVYALSTDGVENASCEFDVATLRPTYKLLIGIPGKSNAFAISEKLGLSKDIISAAKDVLSHEDARFEDVITDLEISRKSVLIEQQRAEQYRLEAEKMKNEMETQKEKLNAQRDKILQKAKEEARDLMQSVKDEADLLKKQVAKQMRENSQKEAEATMQQMRDKLSKLYDDADIKITHKSSFKPAPKNLKKGDRVFIHTLSQSGIVTTPPDQNGEVQVSAGIMKVKVKLTDLSLDDSEKTVKINAPAFSKKLADSKSMIISPSIDLRGEMISEAIEKTDKYLDDVSLSALSQVTIIHGKGTGALRAAIQQHMKNHPHVKSFRLGTFGEGEAGVTIVELKH